mmetsp:Transcript_48624/g.115429  ORF Transcript_48624/g.115429 Transcript_48624/m.115429 type:complete len:233 (+) Transcript_48624:424-1122(+)
MAASCAPVPVRSQTMSSFPLRPFFEPLITSPSWACTSVSFITPASTALLSSPTRRHCAVMSVTTRAFCITAGGSSFLVGWSDPDAMMVAWGLSHFRSSTHSPPEVWVKTTSAFRTASSAVAQALKGYSSSLDIFLQNAEDFWGDLAKAKASSKPCTVAVARAMASAITPVPMNATLLAPLTARCFTATAPAAPVRISVRYLFSCSTAFGPPFVASHTTNTPDPAGSPFFKLL